MKYARARNYDTAREAALDGPNVPVEVYDNLLDTVRDNLDKLHRHAELKRRSLGVDELRMWDVYMPMTDTEGPDLDYEQADEYVIEAVGAARRGLSVARRGGNRVPMDRRVREPQDKRSGAYSGGHLRHPAVHPDELSGRHRVDVHAGTRTRPLAALAVDERDAAVAYSGYEIFVAEVASTVNEALLTHYLLETVEDPEFRRHVLNEYLERFRSTLYRQTLFADFEYRAHQIAENDGALTPDTFDGIYGDLKARVLRPRRRRRANRARVDAYPALLLRLLRLPVLTGISAAVAIAEQDSEGGRTRRRAVPRLAPNGSREYPLELLAVRAST